MPESPLQRLVLALGAIAVAALVAFDVLTWGDGAPRKAAFRPRPHARVARVVAPAPARPPVPLVIVNAVGGDCWLSIRAGSQRGRLLYEGSLADGRRVSFRRRRIWIRAGAAANLRVRVDGHAVSVGEGTLDAVITRAGVSG